MKILITSGGTSQPIDRVRTITNHATGRLGSLIAQVFLDNDHEVTLVTTPNSQQPKPHPHLKLISVQTVDDLLACLPSLVRTHDVIIHSMAVSDYRPIYMTDFEDLLENKNPRRFLHAHNQESKISSKADYQVLFLEKTPKIISSIKSWNPDIQLIGFKLLVDVTQDDLFTVARKSLNDNRADIIVANDLTQINKDHHIAYLLDHLGEERVTTKQELARAIYERVVNR